MARTLLPLFCCWYFTSISIRSLGDRDAHYRVSSHEKRTLVSASKRDFKKEAYLSDLRAERRLFNEQGGAYSFDYKDSSIIEAGRRKFPSSGNVPVWIMRQAGRYLPEFRRIREDYNFFDICQNPILASEVTLQPLTRFPDLNAAIIFSDILVIPQAMGLKVEMLPGIGPKILNPIKSPDDLSRLNFSPNVENTLGYVFDAIFLTRKKLNAQKPVIGFSGAPLTLMFYMIAGDGSDRSWTEPRLWLYNHPYASHKLLTAIGDIVVEYLIKQFDSGAPILQVFDTLAGTVPPDVYEEFGATYMLKIAEEIKNRRPNAILIGFPMDNELSIFNESDFDVISLGYKFDIRYARTTFSKKAIQGNLDPKCMYASDEELRRRTIRMIQILGPQGYIANLGHGMEPGMDPEKVKEFIKIIKEHSIQPAVTEKY